MQALFKIPLEPKIVANYLEDEKDFLIGVIKLLNEVNESSLNANKSVILTELKQNLPDLVERIFPAKDPTNQIKALQQIAKIFAKTFNKNKFSDIGFTARWISQGNGYLGRVVEENYEIAILLYLISCVYQSRALAFVQTSPEYRYYYISAYSALISSIEFLEKINPTQESHYAYPIYQMFQLRKLEIKAEITKSEAFIARKQGDFEKASKLFAGAASYRFSMMSFDLTETVDNRMKILASTELGMACFYLAVGLQNNNDFNQAYLYLLKARSYFENAAKLSEDNTELLEAANKRLDLVNPSIDRLKDQVEDISTEIETLPDPQPLMSHTESEPLLPINDKSEDISRICSNCNARIIWADECSICGAAIIPLK
ncbi:MAG: hypothetical protein ACFFDW_00435 [Candidatus Thorarchaeota archaeon]